MRLPNPYSLSLRDSYREYVKKVENPMPINYYLDIVYGFMKFIINLAYEGNTVVLPEQMGSIGIIGVKNEFEIAEDGKIKGLPIDWNSTKKLWKDCQECKEKKQLLYHFNEHTNGVVYKLFWSTRDVKVENKRLYELTFTRENTRTITPKLLEEGKEYPVVLKKEKNRHKKAKLNKTL